VRSMAVSHVARGARVLLAAFAATLAPAPVAHAARPTFRHVLVVMLENRAYGDVVRSPNAPYVNTGLMPRYATGTNLYVTTHNSPTAYFILAAGKRYEKGDGGSWAGSCATATAVCSTPDRSVFSQLRAAGRSWRVYSEDQQTACQTSAVAKYWPNHNPALFFRQLGPNGYASGGDGTCRQWDLPFSQLAPDVAAGALPDLAYLIPSNCDNMHDSCGPLSNPVRQGDAWLQRVLQGDTVVYGGLAPWAQAHDALILITFDESVATDRQTCCPYARTGGGGHVGLWMIGPPAKVHQGGFRFDGFANLYHLFRAIELNFAFPLLGHAADPGVGDLASLLIDQPATIAVTPAATPPGGRVAVTGAGFPPGASVAIHLGCASAPCLGFAIATATAGADGTLDASFAAPHGLAPGSHPLAWPGAWSSCPAPWRRHSWRGCRCARRGRSLLAPSVRRGGSSIP